MSMPEQTPKSRRRRALGPGLAGMILTVAALAGLMFNGMGRGSPGSVSSLVAADPSVCATSGVASGCSPDPTTTAITDIAPAKPTVGQPVTVDVTVSPSSPGSGTPTGSAVVSDGSQSCTAQLSAGSGSCQLSESAVGTYTLTAAYGGDGNFGSSTSAGTKVSVSKEATVTGLGLSVLSVGYGSGVLENAYVTVTPQFAGTATGTVQVTVDGGYECYLLLAGGEAVCAFDASELPGHPHRQSHLLRRHELQVVEVAGHQDRRIRKDNNSPLAVRINSDLRQRAGGKHLRHCQPAGRSHDLRHSHDHRLRQSRLQDSPQLKRGHLHAAEEGPCCWELQRDRHLCRHLGV